MSQFTNRVREQSEGFAEQSKEFIGDHAASSALLAFGLGVGVGIAVAGLLTPAPHPSYSRVTHRLGHQVLDAMGTLLPDSLKKP